MAYNTQPHDHIATMSEASREYARNTGYEHLDRAWILSPYDVWERNPYYVGAPQPHPEFENEC
jgi:hypothetical protein